MVFPLAGDYLIVAPYSSPHMGAADVVQGTRLTRVTPEDFIPLLSQLI